MDEKRYPFSARRVTVTEVSGYVEADSPEAAADFLARYRGVIEIEAVGPILDQLHRGEGVERTAARRRVVALESNPIKGDGVG